MELTSCEYRDDSLSKIISQENTSVETFYLHAVDSVILNCDWPLSAGALILLDKTQDS